MSKLVWDATGAHKYETGVSNGVLYPIDASGAYSKGVVWNGLTGVTESPSGAEPTPLYADNIKYLNLMSAEEFGATVECYTYPDEFAACNGEASLTPGLTIGQQARKIFGMAYKTIVGNDVESDAYGYKIHIIYGCQASPSERPYQTVNDSPDAITFSYEVTTTPVNVNGFKPTSILIIDSTAPGMTEAKMKAIEDVLFGTDSADARLPFPDEVAAIIRGAGVSSIAVTTQPTKTAYLEGELFDPAGMVITATFEDGNTAAVTGYTWTPDDELEQTDTSITITYDSKTTTVAITVGAVEG